MKNIKWDKSDLIKQIRSKRFHGYETVIGSIYLYCEPIIKYQFTDRLVNKSHLCGWMGSVFLGNQCIAKTRVVTVRKKDKSDKPLRLCQKRTEKLASERLFDYGFVISKQLKRMGLLEEMLSEVGVEL